MGSKLAASAIFTELEQIKALLSGPAAAGPLPAAALGHRFAATDDTEDDEAPLPSSTAPPAAALQAAQLKDLQREVAALRQQQAEGEDSRRRLQEALQAAQADAQLLAQRLHTELQAKQEEVRASVGCLV